MSRPPFRADHVGSLLRPSRLHEARAQAAKSAISTAELTEIEDECIRDAVALQESAGLSAITDGEFRRGHYLVDFLTGFSGIVPTHTSYALAFKGEDGESGETRSMLTVNAKIKRNKPVMVEHFKFLKGETSRTPKMCLPSPTWIHMRGGRKTVSQTVYPDIAEFWRDMVRAFHEEIADLAAAGSGWPSAGNWSSSWAANSPSPARLGWAVPLPSRLPSACRNRPAGTRPRCR